MDEQYKKLKIAERGARISIIAYVLLSVFKLIFGYFFNSKALVADGLNNSTDIMASVAVLIGLRISRKPADDDHAYGHLRAETVSSLIASIIMLAVGLDVLYNGIRSIIFFKAQTPDMISAIVAIIGAVLIYFVYRYNKKIAIEVNSSALMAAAKDNISDAWVSIGTAVGIIASQFGLPWIDPLAAVIVGILICKTGWDIFYEATHNLTDGFDRKELDDIISNINKITGVNNVKDVKARVHGNSTLLDIIIKINPNLNVIESHTITESVEKMLENEFGIRNVIIHVEPDI